MRSLRIHDGGLPPTSVESKADARKLQAPMTLLMKCSVWPCTMNSRYDEPSIFWG